MMLEVQSVTAGYGDITILRDVSFSVSEGQLVALVGSNGAGKTTCLRTISGLVRPSEGTIMFQGNRIDSLPPHKIMELGLAHVPEGRRLFGRLTVMENLLLGAYTRRDKKFREESLAAMFEFFPRLKERRHQRAGTLSGGEQQMLAIGRALMSRPRLLVLDEPSLGLAPIIVEQIFERIQQIKADGMTILLVEQNVQEALEIADVGVVMRTGVVEKSGRAADLLKDESVRKAYMGI